MIRGISAAALACALGACGGSAAPAGGATPSATAPAAPPDEPRVPSGWMRIGDAMFVAHVPQGAEERALTTPSKGRAWSATEGGVVYSVEAYDVSGLFDGPPEEVMTAHAENFFRLCRGELERHRRNDTLRTHTLSVVGTCEHDKRALGEIHLHDGRLEALFATIVGDEGAVRQDEVKAFFRAFRLKSS